MHIGRLMLAATVVAALTTPAAVAVAVTGPATAAAVPKLDHVLYIVEENHGFGDVIGNPAAPNLNYLAKTFGLATNFFGVSPDSSESNYVAMFGGSTLGVTNDDAYWKNKVTGPSLISQLNQAGVSWKAYLQGMPYAGYEGICYPAFCNGAPDKDPLYVSKHDGIQNFTSSWNTADWDRQVPIGTLAGDLAGGDVPRFSFIVPDECHDQHGDPPYCVDSGNIKDPQDQHLVSQGDAVLGELVSKITSAGFWAMGNNAIIVTYDNGDTNQGCCDGNPGGGPIPTVVITSHGPRGITDATAGNHYSTLSAIQHAFGLGCLRFTCDTKNVQPLSALFAVTGSAAIATAPQPQLTWPTPTPGRPAEKLGTSPSTASAGGWTVQQVQTLGGSDNSLGAIAAASPGDVWAVGSYLPDAAASNQDATLAFAEHWNGTKWTVARPPNAGVDFTTLFGVAASGGQAWAVGTYLNDDYRNRALVETWDDGKWSVTDVPQPGTVRDQLFAASAASPDDVWAVGNQEGPNGKFETLAEHWNGSTWSAVPTPDPGKAGNHLYAVDAVSADNVWAVGQQLSTWPDKGLVEHWDGKAWSVVTMPGDPAASELLDGVAVAADGTVYAAGEADSTTKGGQPLVEALVNGTWQRADVSFPHGSDWTILNGVTVVNGTAYAVGDFVDTATDNNDALLLTGTGANWTIATTPQPGSGTNILGGITAAGGQLWGSRRLRRRQPAHPAHPAPLGGVTTPKPAGRHRTCPGR